MGIIFIVREYLLLCTELLYYNILMTNDGIYAETFGSLVVLYGLYKALPTGHFDQTIMKHYYS